MKLASHVKGKETCGQGKAIEGREPGKIYY